MINGIALAQHSPDAKGLVRLSFTENDFFNEDGDFKYYEDEGKLPWQDFYEMLGSLQNVKQLVYRFSRLDEDAGTFNSRTLKADVKSNLEEEQLSIDYIFYGYDRYNLPEDADLPPNSDNSSLLYPEEDMSFRISGSEQITTTAGTFDCTIVEAIGSFESLKKLWMINNKPGIYARIIVDKPGDFGEYFVFELEEVKMID